MQAINLPEGIQVFERGWLSANNILFTGGEKTVLVDSGYCTHAAQTLAMVESALGARPLDVLVNTHLHSDHCGGNAALQGRYKDLATLVPPGHAAQIMDWDPVALTHQPTGQQCPQFKLTDALQPGTNIRFGQNDWEIHAAPGHDPHSVIFFEPVHKILISADALWENGFGVVFPELEGDNAFSDVAATFDIIEKLSPKAVIPGHGSVFGYRPEILAAARGRLEAFMDNPERHARHAAKVLLKFKLLEVQRQDFEEFVGWASSVPYLVGIKERFFCDIAMSAWIEALIAELDKSGVARRSNISIFNA